MFNKYPYTDFHELNLDWFLAEFKTLYDSWVQFKSDTEQEIDDFETAIRNDFHDLIDQFDDFKDYVETYLDNLDYAGIVADYIEEMVNDGTFLDIMRPAISSEVTTWLGDHIEPTTPPIDSSLTISGAGADAKVTGDKFSELNASLPFHRLNYYQIKSGGLATDGSVNSLTNRVHTEIIFAKKGTKISCETGYKFNLCAYDNYALQRSYASAEPDTTAFIYYVAMRSEPYVVMDDSYISLTLARTDDADLWSVVGNTVVLNSLANDCTNSIYIDLLDYEGNAHSYAKHYRERNTALTPHYDLEPTLSDNISTANLCVYFSTNPYGTLSEGAKIFKLSCPGYYIKMFIYRSATIGGYFKKEFVAVNDYELNENTIYLDAPRDNGYNYTLLCVVKSVGGLADKRAVLSSAQVDEIIATSVLYLGSLIDTTLSIAGDFADAKAVGDILYTEPSIESLTFTYGGIDSTGGSNSSNTRIRYISVDTRKGAFWVNSGTEITASAGYKFNVAMYSEYESNDNFVLTDFRSMDTGSFIVPNDCYIRVSIGTTSDSVLWVVNNDGTKSFTTAGIDAQTGTTITGSSAIPLNERVSQLEQNTSLLMPWESANELKMEIPLNAVDFHTLFDELVNNGYVNRTLLGNIGNNINYPVYMYTIRHDMDYIATDYSRVTWNGSNELYERPKIWIDGGIHGNERTMPLAIYSFINKLIHNIYYQDLLNAFDWYFVPLVNPWGFSHSAYNNVIDAWSDGGAYTEATITNYTIYDNTSAHHQGIRNNQAGIDINRDFGDFNTQEARLVRDAIQNILANNEKFIYAIDNHQSTGGGSNALNALGAFLSLHYGATQDDKNMVWSKWMQAGAKTESIMSDYCGVNNTQSIFTWDGSNLSTLRNYMHSYADYSMCLEGGQTCLYYSNSTNWSNEIARTLCNTQLHMFIKILSDTWM